MPPVLRDKFPDKNYDNYSIQQVTPGSERALAGGFRCIRNEFVSRFKQGSIGRQVTASTSQCWVLVSPSGVLAGYITLLADKIDLGEPGVLEEEGVPYTTLPSVKIGMLAADLRASKAGKFLVKWALVYAAAQLAPMVGIRFVTLDAFYDQDVTPHYDVSPFYEKIGFRYANPEETLPPVGNYRTMYYDLKPSLDRIREARVAQALEVATAEEVV